MDRPCLTFLCPCFTTALRALRSTFPESAIPRETLLAQRTLRICHDILLDFQVVEQLEIGIHVVILVQSLQITYGCTRSYGPCVGNLLIVPATTDFTAAGEEQSHANSHQNGQRRRQHRAAEPRHPSRLRFG